MATYLKREATGSVFKVEKGVWKLVDGKWVEAPEQAARDILDGSPAYDEIDAPGVP